MKFHQGLFKILRKQNVTDTLSFVRSFGRTDGQRENSIPSHKHSLRGYKYNHVQHKHWVQHRMISVVNFFRIFEMIIFCFVVAICDLVHAVETMHGIH